MLRPAAVLIVLLVLSGVTAGLLPVSAEAASGPQRMIVLLADGSGNAPPMGARPSRGLPVSTTVRSLQRTIGFQPDHVFRNAVHGFSARLTGTQIAALRASAAVSAVVPDQPISLESSSALGADHTASGGVVSTNLPGKQRIPTGVRRIKADQDPIAAIGGDGGRVDADVAVLDSGIAAHPDLAIAGGLNCTDTGGRDAWGDVMGHGTHVAGIIGALDNGFGVVGVAPGVRLWSVKIIGDDDHGWMSWAVCGLDWVAGATDASGAPRFEAVNMSVGGQLLYPDAPCGVGTDDAYHQAICRVVDAGIPVVVAAGNYSSNANGFRPAAYREAITVAALADFDGLPGGAGKQSDICPWYSVDRDDTYADFSDFGPAVDLIAPGKCILSTYTHGRYAWMSGTSMATPHVTGAVILYRQQYPDASPAAVEAALRAAGTLDWATRTDPDGQPDRLLDVSRFMPPPAFSIDATDPSGYLGADGAIHAHVSIQRSNGQTARIAITGPRLPDGLTVDRASLRGATGTITLRAHGLTESGPVDVAVRAADGVSAHTVQLHLLVDAKPPTATFATPAALTIQATPTVDLAWTVDDAGGSDLVATRLERISAPIPSPGSCDGAATGAPVVLAPVSGPVDAPVGRCSRWVLTARDGAGNRTVRRSAPVLVDTSPPGDPHVLSVSGDGAFAQASATRVWIRKDVTGPVSITLGAEDAQSGVAGVRADPGRLAAGWSVDGGTSAPATTLRVSRRTDANDAELWVRAVNGAGLPGDTMPISLRVDGRGPSAPVWTQPVAGSGPVADHLALDWTPGTDDGSGVARASLVVRQVAPASAAGSCADVAFVADGQPEMATPGTIVTGLRDRSCYRFLLRSLDRVGNLSPVVTSAVVLVDGTPPVVEVRTPAVGKLTLDADGSVPVAWTATDAGGTGVVRTWAQRWSARITTPGACPTTGYTDDTRRGTVAGPFTASGLAGGRCYRWTIGARDAAGNGSTTVTGAVLMDTTPPPVPSVVVSGAGIAWVAADATAWFRADRAGTASLQATAQDRASGVRALVLTAPAVPGWTTTPGDAHGGTAGLSLAWRADAPARTLTAAARNGAGTTGAAVTVRFRPDTAGPRITFSWPSVDGKARPGRQVVAWTEHDSGAGVDGGSRHLAQETAPVAADGTCRGVTWGAAVDVPITGRSAAVTLSDATCVRWTVTLRDRVGHRTAQRSSIVVVRGTAPVVGHATVALLPTVIDARGRIPVRLRWSMRDADRQALTASVRMSEDAGATWRPVALSDPARSSADVQVVPAADVRLAVRVQDASGARSAWDQAPAVKVTVVEDRDPTIGWSGRWRGGASDPATDGHLRWSIQPGAKATVAVHGRAVAWVTRSAPIGGVATVRLDGQVVATIDLRRSRGTDRRIAFVAGLPDAVDHILTVEVAAHGHPGRVPVDAIVVLR